MSDEPPFIVTAAGPSDAVDLGELHVRTWRETYPGLLPQAYLNGLSSTLHARRFSHQLVRARAGDLVLVAEDERGMIGYCAGVLMGKSAEVHTLYVLRRAQGLGAGRALLASAARAFAAQGAERLMLWVLRDNARARGFYARLGGVASEAKTEATAGGVMPQVAYRWEDISVLAGLPA
jgi:ribosomal protein S18 acetylase RimI-like enzyme